MNFENPAAFSWLVPLCGMVVALYLLRMRRRDVQVPAVFLWPQRTEEIRANSLFQKLRFSWLLVLQLLAVAACVLAMARPQFKQKGLSGKVTVVVLDASASMGAIDVKPSRFDIAKRTVGEMIGAASPGDRLALIEAGPTPRVAFPLGDDPTKQRAALTSLHRFDAPSDMGEALRLAAAIVGSTAGSRIVVLSDGDFDKVDDFSPGQASVTYEMIGSSGENVGIQALGTTEGSEGRYGYIGVRNYGAQPAHRSVTLEADGRVVDSVETTIGPGQTWGKTFLVPTGASIVEARLDAGDPLSADDYGVTLANPASSAKVLLVTRRDFFLERALALDPRVVLDKASALPDSLKSGGDGGYDIVVFDGVASSRVKTRGILNFASAGDGTPATLQGSAKGPTFLNAANTPLMRGVDLEDCYIETMQQVRATGSGRVVAEAKEGPLVIESDALQRQVYVSFSPLESDFPLSVGFPILIGNILDFLIGRESSNVLSVRSGQTFALAAPRTEPATVTSPGGGRSTLSPSDGRYVVRSLDRIGRYTIAFGGKTVPVYASLRSPTESSIEPRKALEVGNSTVRRSSSLTRFEDYWRTALVLVVLVLGVEWAVYARRS